MPNENKCCSRSSVRHTFEPIEWKSCGPDAFKVKSPGYVTGSVQLASAKVKVMERWTHRVQEGIHEEMCRLATDAGWENQRIAVSSRARECLEFQAAACGREK